MSRLEPESDEVEGHLWLPSADELVHLHDPRPVAADPAPAAPDRGTNGTKAVTRPRLRGALRRKS